VVYHFFSVGLGPQEQTYLKDFLTQTSKGKKAHGVKSEPFSHSLHYNGI
jgi:hypothetical protein